MADEENDDAQKTEEATQKRLDDAFKKGQGINSREVTNFLLFLVFTITISWIMPFIMNKATLNLSGFIEHAHDIETEGKFITIFNQAFFNNFLLILMPIFLFVISTIFSSFIQNQGRFIFSWDPLSFDLSRISIINGLKRLFSKNTLIEFFKSLAKLFVVFVVCYLSVISEISKISLIHEKSIYGILTILLKIVANMMVCVCITMAIIAALDYFYQYQQFMQMMRMSKHELKEEYKQTEGSPEIKSRIKKVRRDRAKKRMMSQVPTADVIITNPTHFSVALKYDELTMRAPIVIAKGQDHLALKIREIAKEHKIPMVENATLARVLYRDVEVDSEIPIEHYKALAEIISYVYSLKK